MSKVVDKIERAKKFIRDERTLEILEAIAKLGTIAFLATVAPNAAGHIIKLLGWVPDYRSRYRVQRILKSLEKQKFIRFWIKNGKGKLELTREGKLYFAGLKVKHIKLQTKPKWDKLWRIVTFDIPEELKANRRRFSRTLLAKGMFSLERSIFVYPHECKEEIYKIARLYEVDDYICYITASAVVPDSKLKSAFPYTNLSAPK